MLTNDEKVVLTIKFLYFFGIAIANTFAQVYLYNYTGSFFQMSIYTICRSLMIFAFFYCAAKLCTKFNIIYTMILGMIFVASSLMFMLFLKETISDSVFYVYLIGLIWGAGEGLFWFSCVSIQQHITTIQSRSHFFGVSGALSGVAGIGAPLLSATMLGLIPNIAQGYYTIFQITILLFIVASVLSFQIKTKPAFSTFSLKGKILWNKDKRWRWMTSSTYFYGIRDAASFSITGLLIYEATKSNDAFYGNLVSMFAVASVIAYLLASKWIHTTNQTKVLYQSSLLVALSGLILVLLPNLAGAVLHGLLFNLSYAFYDNSFNIYIMNELSQYIETENIYERVVMKEGYFNFGRVTGFLFIMLLISLLPKQQAMVIAMSVLYLFAPLTSWYTIRYEKKKQANES